MADDQKINASISAPEEEISETTGVHTITRSSIQSRLTKPESGVPFYDESSFPQELQLPEALKDNALAVEVHRQAKRILRGQEPNISKRDFDYAKQFMAVLVAPPSRTAEDAAHLQKLESLTNDELTHQLEEQIAFGRPDSILNGERSVLGITSENLEKPFAVRVLEVGGKDAHEKAEKWKEVSKAHDMFVYEKLSGESTIFVPAERAKMILDSDAEEGVRMDAIKTLCHEYRHTQRSAALGKNKGLFRFIDEPLADIIGYQYLTVFLNLLTKTTDTIKFGELFDAYEGGDSEYMADCFSRIADAFSAKGLLLLGGKNSSECSADEDGMGNLPLAGGNYTENEWLQMAETILALRNEKDADWLAKLANNLQSDQIPLKQIEISYLVLLVQFKPDSIQTSDARLVRELFMVIQTEIERRRALGEEGIYKKAA